MPARAPSSAERVDVTAVLVVHDGAAWLPDALAALAAQTVRPARVVFVDTGSTDASPDLLSAAATAGEPVVELGPDVGFGAAVQAGLDHAGAPTRWVWLLHDDAAPAPDALAALLAHAQDTPSAALLGPKALDWHDPRLLVEVGLTTDRAGHRETGLERREYDQGQHDAPRDVLAVGTAGALVRRDVWTELGGLDPALPVFRDDLDLGWRVNAAGHRVVVVPAARVRHVRAATTGRRRVGAVRGRAAGVDRRHALFVLLAHTPARWLVPAVLRLVLACVLRALGFLLTRQVLPARDELAALGGVLGRPRRLRAARRERALTRTLPARALRPLFASPLGRARHRVETVAGMLAGSAPRGNDPLRALGDPGPEGPDDVPMPGGGGEALRRALLRPGVLLVLGLALAALVAERALLSVGGGVLAGGRLLPPAPGAGDLWSAYASSWQPTGVGTGAPAPPLLLALAVLSTLLLGKAWLAVDLVLLGSVPLAGAVAYLVAGRLVRSTALRLWAAATWALLPVATGAVAAGRLDAAAVQVGLPPVLLAGARLLLRGPSVTGWRSAWAVGLGLALLAAFSPALWPVAGVLALGGGVAAVVLGVTGRAGLDRGQGLRRLLAAVVVSVVPLLVLWPWSLAAVPSAGLLLHGPGPLVPELTAADLPAWDVLLLSPGGPGTPLRWLTAGLLLAALAALLRTTRRAAVRTAWAVALGGLALALVLARLVVAVPAGAGELAVWPGAALQVAAAGLLAAAVLGGEGARERLARASFGWRQPLAALVAVAAALAPVLLAGAWVARGADDPLRRDLPALLPAFAEAELAGAPGMRVLVLDPRPDGTVAYELTSAGGARLDTALTAPAAGQVAALDALVADLLSPRGSTAARALATRAVRYVALPAGPAAAPLADVLDQQDGLTRRSEEDVLLWRVVAPAARLTVLPPELAGPVAAGAPALPARAPDAAALLAADADRLAVPPGPDGRLLVLAEAADDDWTATAGGRALEPRTAHGWAQAFALPAEGGEVRVARDRGTRTTGLLLQALAVVAVAVLAAPGARRRRGLEVADGDGDDDEPPAREPRPAGRSRSGRHAAPAGASV